MFREGGPSANPISKESRLGTRKGLVNQEGSSVLHSRNVISCRVEGTCHRFCWSDKGDYYERNNVLITGLTKNSSTGEAMAYGR